VAAVTVARRCARCGGELPTAKRGRPRKYCETCAASVAVVGKAVAARAWRAANAEAVAARNERRRRPRQHLVCSECGEPLEGHGGKRYCSTRCRNRRYRRLHPEQEAEKQRRKYARRRERAKAAGNL